VYPFEFDGHNSRNALVVGEYGRLPKRQPETTALIDFTLNAGSPCRSRAAESSGPSFWPFAPPHCHFERRSGAGEETRRFVLRGRFVHTVKIQPPEALWLTTGEQLFNFQWLARSDTGSLFRCSCTVRAAGCS